MPIILSLDGGSTSLKIGLIDTASKSIISQMQINSAFNYRIISKEGNSDFLNEIVAQIPKKSVDYVILGISGADTKEEINNTYNILKSIFEIYSPKAVLKVFNDVDLVLNNTESTLKNKVAIISGTGSNCVGINDKNERAKAGGLDYILSDQGSGYSIGLLALQSAVEAEDGRAKPAELTNKIYEKLQVKTASELKNIVYQKSFTKKDYAKLALPVIKLASENDRLSIQILQQASYELFKHVKAVANKLELKGKECLILEAGSMFKVKEIINPFEEMVHEYLPEATVELPKNPSFWGAINLI